MEHQEYAGRYSTEFTGFYVEDIMITKEKFTFNYTCKEGVDHIKFINIGYVIAFIFSCIITVGFYKTDKTPRVKRFIYKLFLLDKFPPDSIKHLFSKVLMIVYVFLMCNYIISFLININLNIKPVLIVGILYPLGFRAFFNGSYER